eukprot:m.307382 g.307382  ORF g.307382 m.307382 type:complete len:194 (+) comp42221_c0_seq1:331-912(+)
MKLVVCFVFFAFVGNSLALQCYSCLPSSASECTTKTTCTFGQIYCRTDTVLLLGSGSKSCSSTCTPSSGITSSTTCCQTDLCNGPSQEVPTVPPFQCYSCKDSASSYCPKIATCGYREKYCYSTKGTTLGVTTYTKDCSDTCTISFEDKDIGRLAGASTTCCQDNLCNAGAGETVKISTVALLLAVLAVLVAH